jgi:hypothetical protein
VKFGTRTHRVSGQVRVPVRFCKWVSFGFFRVSFRFLVFLGFFRVWGGFGFRVHPRVKNEIRTQTQFCAVWVWVWVTGAKNAPEPTPIGCKTRGLPETEPELPSLIQTEETIVVLTCPKVEWNGLCVGGHLNGSCGTLLTGHHVSLFHMIDSCVINPSLKP